MQLLNLLLIFLVQLEFFGDFFLAGHSADEKKSQKPCSLVKRFTDNVYEPPRMLL